MLSVDAMLWLAVAGVGVVTVIAMLYALCSRTAYEIGVHELRRRVADLCYEREMQVLRISVGDEALAAVRARRTAQPMPTDAKPDRQAPDASEPARAAA